MPTAKRCRADSDLSNRSDNGFEQSMEGGPARLGADIIRPSVRLRFPILKTAGEGRSSRLTSLMAGVPTICGVEVGSMLKAHPIRAGKRGSNRYERAVSVQAHMDRMGWALSMRESIRKSSFGMPVETLGCVRMVHGRASTQPRVSLLKGIFSGGWQHAA